MTTARRNFEGNNFFFFVSNTVSFRRVSMSASLFTFLVEQVALESTPPGNEN